MTEIMNLLHNPVPLSTGGKEFTDRDMVTVDLYGSYYVRVTARRDFAYALRGITLPAGDWVYSAFLFSYTGSGAPSTTENRGLYIVRDGAVAANQPITGVGKRYTIQFHLEAQSTVSLRLSGPATIGESFLWGAMLLASKQDYDYMRTLTDAAGKPLNLTWFSGSTYPRNGGGCPCDGLTGYPPCEHWTVAA